MLKNYEIRLNFSDSFEGCDDREEDHETERFAPSLDCLSVRWLDILPVVAGRHAKEPKFFQCGFDWGNASRGKMSDQTSTYISSVQLKRLKLTREHTMSATQQVYNRIYV